MDYVQDRQLKVAPKYAVSLVGDNTFDQLISPQGCVTLYSVMLYLMRLDDGTFKLGMVGEDWKDPSEHVHKTPARCWQDRYWGHKSDMGTGCELMHIFIVNRNTWQDIMAKKKLSLAIDDSCRQLIRKKYNDPRQARKIPFSALFYSTQTTDEFKNKENLVNYDHSEVHFEILKDTVKELMDVTLTSVDVIKFVERLYQTGDVELLIDLLTKYRKVLLNAYTSYGKTLISTAVIIRLLQAQGGGFAIVSTPRTDTLGDFEINPFKFDFGNKIKPMVIRQDEIKQWPASKIQKYIAQGHVVILLVSVQGVRHKGQAESNDTEFSHEKFKRYKRYFDLCDLWVRDEKWTEYGGAKTAKLMKHLEGNMLILDLAATSSKIKDDYDTEAVVDRSLFWAMKNRKLTDLPRLKIDSIYWSGLRVIDQLADVYTAEENFYPPKLFVGNSESTDFAHRSILETLPEYFYHENALAKKLGISIVDDPELSALSKRVGFWVLPQGNKAWPSEIYMPELAKIWNARYCEQDNTLFISAYELERMVSREEYDTTNDCIKDLLNKYQRVVILTHRKYTVGTSIDHLGHIVLWDSISSDDLFEQLLGRLLRLVLEGDKNIKDLVKIKAMVPNMQLVSTLARMVVEHSDKTDSNSSAKEYFDLLGLKCYDASGSPVSVRGDDVVDEIAKQRLAVSGSGLKPTEVQQYLSDSDTVQAWRQAQLPQLKFKNGKLQLTDDNGAKKKKPGETKSSSKLKDITEEQIRKIMNEVFGMVKVAAYCEGDK